MGRVYGCGGLYTLNLHPERGQLCRRALDALLAYARGLALPVWVARIGEVAQWWKERGRFRLAFTPAGEHRWRIEAACSPKATILVRNLAVEGGPTAAWCGCDALVQSHSFEVSAPVCPCIGVSEQTPRDVDDFLYEQGYPFVRCAREDARLYAAYLDQPEGLGASPEERTAACIALVDRFESLDRPFLRFGCWPDSSRAALAVSGDIDSVTVQDFFLRVVEVLRQK